MADVAELDLKIGAKIEGAKQGLQQVQQDLVKTSTAAQKVDSSLDALTTSLNKISNTNTKVAKSFDEVSSEIFKSADAFNAKWNPVVEQATKEAAAGTTEINKLAAAVQKFGGGVQKFTSPIASATAQISKIGDSSTRANFALQNLGRVVQDAPFGFIGISNNIPPLIESFTALRASAAATGTTMKTALISAFSGPGGLLFIVSVATSLLVSFGPALFSTKEAAEDLSGSVQKTTFTLKDYSEEVQKAIDNNSNLTRSLDVLSKAFGTKLLVESLDQKFQDKIIKPLAQARLELSKLQNVDKFILSDEDFKEEESRLKKRVESLTNTFNKSLEGFGIIAGGKDNLFDILDPKDTGKKVETVTGILKELLKELDFLGSKEQAQNLSLTKDKINAIQDAIDSLLRININPDSNVIKTLVEQMNRLFSQLDKGGEIAPISFPIKINPTVNVDNLKNSGSLKVAVDVITEQMQKLMDEGFQFPANFFRLRSQDRKRIIANFEQIGEIVESSLGDVFSKIAENVGNFKNPFAGVLEIIGQGLVQIGKAVILSSALLSKIKIALNAVLSGTGAGKGIAVGIGLIALGTLLKRLPKFAEGGIATKATAGIFGEAGPEAILPLDRLKDFIKPDEQQVILLDSVIRGSDLVLSINREQRKIGRKY